jgi:hypothetical protein
MAIQFPDLVPTDMSFDPPQWPVGEDVSIGGVYTARRFGSKPSEGRLNVEFENIANSAAASVYAAHALCKGIESVIFYESFFNGAGPELLPYLNASAYPGLRWFFVKDAPPRIRRVKGGSSLSSMSIEFRARLVAG